MGDEMWTTFRAEFEASRLRPEPPVDEGNEAIPAAWRAVLAASLARFQAGETGEGRIVHEIGKVGWSTVDADYRESMRLFIAEEGRHARLLGRAVKSLGGRPAPAAWTEMAFRFGRRAVGIRTKLIVLWAAEIGAVVGYGALVERLPACGLQVGLTQMIADEHRHLAFHTAFFRRACADRASRLAAEAALTAAVTAAVAVMWADHRELWGAIGVGRGELAARAFTVLRSTVTSLERTDRSQETVDHGDLPHPEQAAA